MTASLQWRRRACHSNANASRTVAGSSPSMEDFFTELLARHQKPAL
ncbi:hypothetical protein ACWCXL_21180 [Streptomyces sp. NPDC001588]